MSTLTIVSVFPELLGTYGDAGNVAVLERRLAWRGIDVEVLPIPVSARLPTSADLYVLGGSEDDNQQRALAALHDSGLAVAVQRGAHVFAVCAGFQLLGESLHTADGSLTTGLGLLDARTTRLPNRIVGEVSATFAPELGLPALTGFANHGGGTALGAAAAPLARTTAGRGNDGRVGGPEGALQGRVVATYLHGPVLARNPAFADWLLERVTGLSMAQLPNGAPEALHDKLMR